MKRILLSAALSLTCVLYASAQTRENFDAPATVVIPAHVTLKQVFDGHRRAVHAMKQPKSTIETWDYSAGQLSGTQVEYRAGDDYREDTTLGPFVESEGSYRGHRWDRNANGLTVQMTDLHQRDNVDEHALSSWGKPQSGVTLIGESAQPHAYVVRVSPKGGRLEYRFYDTSTFLLVRTEKIVEDRRVVTEYDDYRTVNGIRRPWHVHSSDGRPYNEFDWTLRAVQDDPVIDVSKFTAPASAQLVHFSSARSTLPATISDDRIIVTVQMAGRKVNLQLDSGAAQILLDRSVVDALKFPSYGKTTQTTAGSYTATRTIVPQMRIGDAVMENVAVTSAPFERWGDPKTPIAGLLGYDFISGTVVHIDYEHGNVEALSPDGFTPPEGSIVLPVRLDDRVPVVSVNLGNLRAEHFILDTGADRSLIFSSFADAHLDELRDQGLGTQYDEAYPFFNRMLGVGGEVKTTHLQVPALTFGSAKFSKMLFIVSHDAAAFESEDFDGLLGQDVLRNFDVYLDYPHLRVCLVPNSRYRARWG